MDEMVEWLRGVVTGDLEAAKAATAGPWSVDSPDYPEAIKAEDGTAVVAGSRWAGEASVFESDEDALHIARHDPRDTIARCEEELAIIDDHGPFTADHGPAEGKQICRMCSDINDHYCYMLHPCDTLKRLARGRRFRDGWKAEWGTLHYP